MQINSHLSVLIHDLAKKWGDKPALTFRKFGSDQWQTVSFNLFSLRVKQVSNALLNLGAKPLDKIAVFSQNCVHYLYTDFGAYGIRVTSVPFYANSSEQQIQYMINDAQIRFLFVGEQEQYDKAHRIFALCPSLERIIIFDSSVRISTHDPAALYFKDFLKLGENLPRQTEVEELYKQASMDDLANILYTSGTTGDSKGVMLTYSQYYAALKANDECIPVTDKDRVIDFLPFTHIFERGWAYLCL
ncbi:MAG: AMP-binding protein, partial [Segatella copri]